MKLFLVAVCIVAVTGDRLENTYLPPDNAKTAGGDGNTLNTPNGAPSSNYGAPNHASNSNGAPSSNYGAPNHGQNGNAAPSSNYGAPNHGPSGNGAPSSNYGAPSHVQNGNGAPSTNYGAPNHGQNGNGAPSSTYGSPNGNGHFGASSGSAGFNSNGAEQPEGPDARAAILRFNNENNGDGSYSFEFETENKIMHQETGELRNAGTDQEAAFVQGTYSYEGPDGVTYTVTYIADENGFRASGDHIPTPPPIPEAIQKSLEQNSAEEANQNGNGYNNEQNGYSQNNNEYEQKNGNGQNGYHQNGKHQNGEQQNGNGHQINSNDQNGNGYPSGGPKPAYHQDQSNQDYHESQAVVIDSAAKQYQPPQTASRQYLAPNKPNFNQQSGYNY